MARGRRTPRRRPHGAFCGARPGARRGRARARRDRSAVRGPCLGAGGARPAAVPDLPRRRRVRHVERQHGLVPRGQRHQLPELGLQRAARPEDARHGHATRLGGRRSAGTTSRPRSASTPPGRIPCTPTSTRGRSRSSAARSRRASPVLLYLRENVSRDVLLHRLGPHDEQDHVRRVTGAPGPGAVHLHRGRATRCACSAAATV